MTVILIAVFVIVLDFITKLIVNLNMSLYESVTVIPGILNFTYIRNDGAAWGMLDDKRWIFLILSSVAIILISVILIKYRDSHIMMRIPLALILGGGIGNMIDRIFYTEEFLNCTGKLFGEGYKLFNGVVIDFIEAAFIDFPIFNIADCAVTVGTVLLFVYVIFIDGKIDKNKKRGEKSETECKISSGDGEKVE